MFGAVRPPWIDKEMFYRMPFNFCDRWCERCNLTDICRVFKDIKKSEKKFKRQGKNPNSWECTLEMVEDNFKKVKSLLKKDAKKWGIDLNAIDNSDEDSFPEAEDFLLYRLVYQYSEKLKSLLEELSFVVAETDNNSIIDNMEIISYYHLLLPAKIYRACTSKQEEEQDKDDITLDSKTSGFIAVRALESIIQALAVLANYSGVKLTKGRITSLKEVSQELVNLIAQEFDLETKN